MVGVPFDDEDDRRSVRSTSTVASTAGTGALSLASRMSALNLEFSEKLNAEMGVAEGQVEQSILEEDEEEYGARSERTMNTAVTGEGDEVGGEDNLEDPFTTQPLSSFHASVGLTDGLESPDSFHSFSQRSPFQICSRIFAKKCSILLKRLSIRQMEELRQHGYAILDNFITADLAEQIKTSTLQQFHRGRMSEAPWIPADAQQRIPSTSRPCHDYVMPLCMGKPPADTSPMATLLVALQELYDDLAEFVRLRRVTGEYQVSFHQGGSPGVARHRDALPDGGRKQGRRRLTCMVCCSGSSEDHAGTSSSDEHVGSVTIWPPRRSPGTVPSERHTRYPSYVLASGANPSAAFSARRSFTGSEGGTSYSESDTCSLRSHYMGNMGGGGIGYGAGSIHGALASMSSSLWAEAASVLDGRDDGTTSVDNMSINESLDGSVMAAMGNMSSAAVQIHFPSSAAAMSATDARLSTWSSATHAAAPQSSLRPTAGLSEQVAVKGLEWVEVEGEMALRVSPLPGRLVVFLSGAVDHAHQPVSKNLPDLVTVTAWYQ
ncbi:hypothetical protein CEUSTIGMA_g12507.t1 [Chlamydomonas eustigma]|uniref:Prolyl 4-hydroxylase alpha subunit Fe(2+) 2OG dioxygenase domain-containing protein n=1 Tax=Chlamydomonas eustigma TaxID=1157962 RepID=A0A250XPT6_9CHLO|nr:hypothetical protein CEUSTIGMA_g12507.t1 [Chlamydomonas eustigma]|eukprot:GAX85087.1 hypothetical protein CEUSTIGMA_g12507.t1 [Chlamydomonas eustigma]